MKLSSQTQTPLIQGSVTSTSQNLISQLWLEPFSYVILNQIPCDVVTVWTGRSEFMRFFSHWACSHQCQIWRYNSWGARGGKFIWQMEKCSIKLWLPSGHIPLPSTQAKTVQIILPPKFKKVENFLIASLLILFISLTSWPPVIFS